MKKIFLSLVIATLLFSCKEETNEKVKDATKSVATDVKQSLDSGTKKAEKVIDTSKIKVKNLIVKGAEKVEEGAKKIKEAAKK
jgi:hypothetical protein